MEREGGGPRNPVQHEPNGRLDRSGGWVRFWTRKRQVILLFSIRVLVAIDVDLGHAFDIIPSQPYWIRRMAPPST